MPARGGSNPGRLRSRPAGTLLEVAGVLALLSTVVLTVPRLLEPRSYPVAVLAAAAPLSLLTGMLAVLLLSPAVVSARRGLPTVAAALALGLVVLHAGWLAPAFTGPGRSAADDAELVVMVQNLEYGDVKDLTRVVEQHDVDVLVLLDLGPDQLAAVESSGLAARFAVGHPSPPAVGTLVLSRHRIDEVTELSADGRSHLHRVSSSPIGPFVLAAAHPNAPYTHGTRTWRRDLDAIGAGVAEAGRATGGAVLVLGDLNATPDHRPFRDLLRKAELRDAGELANTGWAPTFPAHGLHMTRGLRLPPVVSIDHVLLGSAFTVTSLERVDVAGADHLGLVAHVARAAN